MAEDPHQIHDVLIIGGGPCGFAVAARLRERTPSALFTDDEHNRYHWIAKHAKRASIIGRKTGKVRKPVDVATRDRSGSSGSDSGSAASEARASAVGPSMLVLDSSGADWLAKWHSLFALLEIQHLRSPMFFHPDPQDRDGLLAFAHGSGRARELVEIGGCVGQEMSKHRKKKRMKSAQQGRRAPLEINERDREDYFTPGTALFRDYCDSVAGRYGLKRELIRNETVLDVVWIQERKLFLVKSDNGTHMARAVVLAVGAGNAPPIPAPFPQTGLQNASHAFKCAPAHLDSHSSRNVLVIGGGLTSAQIADRAIRHGNGRTKVWHIMRGPLKLKPFDVDLAWMSKFRNVDKGAFWSCDTDAERMQQIQSARGGGSITPRFDKLLKQHMRTGHLVQLTHTRVVAQRFDAATRQWRIGVRTTPPAAATLHGHTADADMRTDDDDDNYITQLPPFDHIFFATGVASNIATLPYLQSLLAHHPIPLIDGLPAITDDLQWCADVPLFVTGKFAALRLGPGAGNLEGARLGAERVAWALGEMGERRAALRRGSGGSGGAGSVGDEEEDELMNDGLYRYAAGIENRFASLSVAD